MVVANGIVERRFQARFPLDLLVARRRVGGGCGGHGGARRRGHAVARRPPGASLPASLVIVTAVTVAWVAASGVLAPRFFVWLVPFAAIAGAVAIGRWMPAACADRRDRGTAVCGDRHRRGTSTSRTPTGR